VSGFITDRRVSVKDFVGVETTGKKASLPQSLHGLNEDGKCTEFDSTRWTEIRGNTGGLGGFFAFLWCWPPLFLSRGKALQAQFTASYLEGATELPTDLKSK
jgi:hypothetical protein